jgi:hypothetical protein
MKFFPFPHDPRGPHDIVAGRDTDREVARGFGDAVGVHRGEGHVLPARFGGASVEHVVAREVDQDEPVCGGESSQCRRTGRVGLPRRRATRPGFGSIDVGVGGRVDDHVDHCPVRTDRTGDVQLVVPQADGVRENRRQRVSDLAARAEDDRAHRHRSDVNDFAMSIT